ncbi:MAG: histidine triad nucleotide-binding protein [Chloroflexi bacterium GWB2_49_20]|nr:MAG: histidine triad nucleotide-binding protein [Chloroflexi bacterium GWB2_49_20]OGN76848.1 MAG: histidine triad nucleotide-binding protein [Chloroflexi bacterium GWC2_49_37]OGN84368.1 MAG: histidine triad nucleotide-binding protein [Chloroflexi bacterium GWD2_49_16]HCC78246.1 histidine triad nucleotide-binding protein [Anaerolineae bacterium]HCM96720.1 histidine triad nucleotide-binding protein [Anaerolineae bacterium]
MINCTFCKIIAGEIPGKIAYKDDLVTAFHDINPVAPTHILVIPNKHIASTNDITQQDEALLGHMLLAVKKIAADQGIAEKGYRLIINTGPDANQVVQHLHVHIIGGHYMRHPMG